RDTINRHPAFAQAIDQNSPGWALVMCFEHERIHLETSSVLMREMPLKYLRRPDAWPALPGLHMGKGRFKRPVPGLDYPDENPMIDVSSCQVSLGKPVDWPTFGW